MQKGQMEQKSAKKVDGEGDSLIFGSAMVRNVCIYYVWGCYGDGDPKV